MKKMFIVEINYEELPENVEKNAHVLYDTGLEVTLENMMEGYIECGSIKNDYEVKVKQTDQMQKELRDLMYLYTDKYEKLVKEYYEAKENEEETDTIECLQRQCRIMIAELWKVMVKIGALDEEEIEFGSIKIR